MLSTFETLPDEILMIILQYSGNVYNIFRTFSGLNQRLNNILVDRRLHLLTDFLCMYYGDPDIDYYYNSTSFHNISQQLSSLTITDNDRVLRRCLQSLVAFHIEEQSKRLRYEFQSSIEHFQSIRSHLTNDDMQNVDEELKNSFDNLQKCPISLNIERIVSLVVTKGARLECDDSESSGFNLAKAINLLLLAKISIVQSSAQRFINSLIRMFKSLIISNLNLLENRDCFYYDGCRVHFFLLCSIYQVADMHGYRTSSSINMQYYHAALDLLLFIIQCFKHIYNKKIWANMWFLDILSILPSTDDEIFIRASQVEILDIILNEYVLENRALLNNDLSDIFQRFFDNLIENNRLYMILFIYHAKECARNFFQKSWNNQKHINMLTRNRTTRQLFLALLDDDHLRIWLASTDLLFVLLRKKECKFVKKLLKFSPSLVHRYDKDDNDPLLYVCLKVRGCRQRLIEFLIAMGCDLERRNSHGENFIDALQLVRNRKLLERLIERGVIRIDDVSGKMTVLVNETNHIEMD